MAGDMGFDPDAFIVTLPVWHIVRCVHDRLEVVETRDAAGLIHVAAFTDHDLALRFLEQINEPLATEAAYRTPAAWLQFLEYLLEAGHELIELDPEAGRPIGRNIYAIANLVRALRASGARP